MKNAATWRSVASTLDNALTKLIVRPHAQVPPQFTSAIKSPSFTLSTRQSWQQPQRSICLQCRHQTPSTMQISTRGFATSRSMRKEPKLPSIGVSAKKTRSAPPPRPKSISKAEVPTVKKQVPDESRGKERLDVTIADKNRVFGEKFPLRDAQNILMAIQARRLSGSLAEEGLDDLPPTPAVADRDLMLVQALDYLREIDPLDEEANRDRYVAEQEAIEKNTLLAKAQSWGLYKKNETDGDADVNYAHGLSAVDKGSVLIQRRLAREAERAAEKEANEKALAEGGQAARDLAAKDQNKGLVLPWQRTELDSDKQARNEYLDKLRLEAEIDPEKIMEERSTISRLLAPTVFALTLGALAYAFAEFYTPPAQVSRMWPNTAPSISTCWTILIFNGLVFVAWRRPELWKRLNKNFLLVAGHPNSFSMLGNLFSHQQLGHFFVNMAALMLIGPAVHEEIGRGNFVALFLISGLTGSLTNLYFNVLTRSLTTATIGASGCLYGLMGAFFTLREDHAIKVPFTDKRLSYSPETGLVMLLVLEAAAFFAYRGQGGIDHLSHLGGLVAGLVYSRILKARASRSATSDEVERVE